MKKYTLNSLTAAVICALSGYAQAHSHAANTPTDNVTIDPVQVQKLKKDAELHRNLTADFNAPLVVDNTTDASQTREWHGPVTTRKVLTILMEFADVPHNTIKPENIPSRHYYENYTPEHYYEMTFSKNGYEGPRGETLPSMREYFLDQSGGSFDVEGGVFGWYKAKFDHPHYKQDTHALIKEAVYNVLADENFNLSDYDLDNDGQIDHLSIIHSTLGEESEPRALRPDPNSPFNNYIWSHRHSINQDVFNESVGKTARIGSYVIQPIDATIGLLAHELGHDLGLPDEYDTVYSEDKHGGVGETVSAYSSMASGSWGGVIRGTKPTGYSPYAKLFLQNKYGGNWIQSQEINAAELTGKGVTVKFSQAGTKGLNNDLVKINLPEQTKKIYEPLHANAFDLTSYSAISFAQSVKGTEAATLSFSLNSTQSINGAFGLRLLVDIPSAGISGALAPANAADLEMASDGRKILTTGSTWTTVNYDISFLAQFDDVTFTVENYAIGGEATYVAVDNIVVSDGDKVLNEITSNTPEKVSFVNSASLSDGTIQYTPYYLLEWRQHVGFDASLKEAGMEEGLLVWYVDPSYVIEFFDVPSADNLVGAHPGEGWIGIVDADRNPILEYVTEYSSTGQWVTDRSVTPLNSRRQIKDAAFNTVPQLGDEGRTTRTDLANGGYLETVWRDQFTNANPRFADWDDYTNYIRPATGKKLPKLGLMFEVVDQSADGATADVKISKMW
ncbi:immune inhibitor A domain-containing protein [Pseudoalteromonas obscura]|uniref:Immune inhibitor A n=1 Tax=Pseudoalteromonas obscura TaxID=3048491 RepID=A0ABT7EMA4_9GAMM|nr:immune inhibitor A domain-containing protein [Pseudoalteromonas sp. P94(2023)]MDK2596186.1 immune inhibitor A [Pseudoalteromonas sp. P94(2023)]